MAGAHELCSPVASGLDLSIQEVVDKLVFNVGFLVL
jgi:hypothetical protein